MRGRHSSIRGESTPAGFREFCGTASQERWRALLSWPDEGVRPYMVRYTVRCLHNLWVGTEFWQVLPEEFATIDHFAAAHVEKVDGQHAVFEVIAEHVGI